MVTQGQLAKLKKTLPAHVDLAYQAQLYLDSLGRLASLETDEPNLYKAELAYTLTLCRMMQDRLENIG